MPVKDQFYGDRGGSVKDANGNIWWIATHKEDLTPERDPPPHGGGASEGERDRMAVNVERIRADIEAIARCTETPGNGATRPTFSRAWGEARAYVIAQAEARRLRGPHRRRRQRARAPEVARLGRARPGSCGSHIDTVPHGGDYDGVAGVVVALELLRSAREDGVDAAARSS